MLQSFPVELEGGKKNEKSFFITGIDRSWEGKSEGKVEGWIREGSVACDVPLMFSACSSCMCCRASDAGL